MSDPTGPAAAIRTLAYLWHIWRQYGLGDCLTTARRKVRFRQLNLGQPPGNLVFRDQMRFRVAPEAVSAFLYFTNLDPAMCREVAGYGPEQGLRPEGPGSGPDQRRAAGTVAVCHTEVIHHAGKDHHDND